MSDAVNQRNEAVEALWDLLVYGENDVASHVESSSEQGECEQADGWERTVEMSIEMEDGSVMLATRNWRVDGPSGDDITQITITVNR